MKRNSFGKLTREWYLGCRLLDAMKFGKLEDVLLIIRNQNIDPNVIIPEYGITPMHCAAGIEPEELGERCIIELLKKGGDPNIKCSEGVTPVHVASCWSRLKVLNILLRYGGDPKMIDDEGNDAFHYASSNEVVNALSTRSNHNENNEDILRKTLALLNENKQNSSENNCKDGDLSLNPTALSLIVKHRQGIFIYESHPEDSSSSSSTIETELNEDFYYDPIENQLIRNVEDKSNSNSSELFKEDILNTDKSHVINVIKNNVNKSSKNKFDINRSDSVSNLTANYKGSLADENDYKRNHQYEKNEESLCEQTNVIDDLENDSESNTRKIKNNKFENPSNKHKNKMKRGKRSKNQIIRQSNNNDHKLESEDNIKLKEICSEEEDINSLQIQDKSSRCNDIDDERFFEFEKNQIPSDNEGFSQRQRYDESDDVPDYDKDDCFKKSHNLYEGEIKANSEEDNDFIIERKYSTDLDDNDKISNSSIENRYKSSNKPQTNSKEQLTSSSSSELFCQTSSNYLRKSRNIKRKPKSQHNSDKCLGKSNPSENILAGCSKLPKNIRDKLLYFKVNSHYRSKTRIVKISSCDGFKTKKSLYETGYEYWTTKVRSKSFPWYENPTKRFELLK